MSAEESCPWTISISKLSPKIQGRFPISTASTVYRVMNVSCCIRISVSRISIMLSKLSRFLSSDISELPPSWKFGSLVLRVANQEDSRSRTSLRHRWVWPGQICGRLRAPRMHHYNLHYIRSQLYAIFYVPEVIGGNK